jgi:hypothetical protein
MAPEGSEIAALGPRTGMNEDERTELVCSLLADVRASIDAAAADLAVLAAVEAGPLGDNAHWLSAAIERKLQALLRPTSPRHGFCDSARDDRERSLEPGCC